MNRKRTDTGSTQTATLASPLPAQASIADSRIIWRDLWMVVAGAAALIAFWDQFAAVRADVRAMQSQLARIEVAIDAAHPRAGTPGTPARRFP
jgi:ubiquinone biosynthesis protein UbiJ